MAETLGSRAVFDAVIYPNQSLTRRQTRWLLAAFTLIAATIGCVFALSGAWPIAGFFGLDIVLLIGAFRLVQRNAQRCERVRLEHDRLIVEAVHPGQATRRWSFEPFWVQVHIDNPPRRNSLIILSSHGRRIRLGLFLTPDERLRFAMALRGALERWRRTFHAPR